jgi:hypothetical protein
MIGVGLAAIVTIATGPSPRAATIKRTVDRIPRHRPADCQQVGERQPAGTAFCAIREIGPIS